MKESFKLICNLIYEQKITYEEAYILIKDLFEKEQNNSPIINDPNMLPGVDYPYPTCPYRPGIPIEVWYNKETGTIGTSMSYDGKFGPVQCGVNWVYNDTVGTTTTAPTPNITEKNCSCNKNKSSYTSWEDWCNQCDEEDDID